MGLPSEKAQYVHRVGRTARAGKTGQGLILLADFERYFLKELRDLPLAPAPELPDMAAARAAAAQGLRRVDPEVKAQAYRTWLGFYKAYAKACGWSLPQLVDAANHFARIIGACPSSGGALSAKALGSQGLTCCVLLRRLQRGAHHRAQGCGHDGAQGCAPSGLHAAVCS